MNTPLRKLVLLLAIWGALAAAAGSIHVLSHLPLIARPLLTIALTVGFSLAVARVGWLRDTVDRLGIRTLLAFHLIRFVGIYFLWLNSQGLLAVEFAERAGWGDIAAATVALGLIFLPDGAGFRRALFWWNVLGFADLLVAVGTAGWLASTRPASIGAIAELPLVLLPLWIVPLLLASHVYLLRTRVRRDADTARPIVARVSARR